MDTLDHSDPGGMQTSQDVDHIILNIKQDRQVGSYYSEPISPLIEDKSLLSEGETLIEHLRKPSSENSLLTEKSKEMNRSEHRYLSPIGDEDLNFILSSPYNRGLNRNKDGLLRSKESKTIRTSIHRSLGDTRDISDFERAMKQSDLDSIEGDDEDSSQFAMKSFIALSKDLHTVNDAYIKRYILSYPYTDAIPDLRPTWVVCVLDNTVTYKKMQMKVWYSPDAIKEELECYCTFESDPEVFNLLVKIKNNNTTIEDLKLCSATVSRLIERAPTVSYVLMKEHQSFRYHIVSTRFHELLKIAHNQEKDHPARIDVSNEAIVLCMNGCKDAFKWICVDLNPSLEDLMSEICRHGSISTFEFFRASIVSKVNFNALKFTKKAANRNNSELCSHIVSILKKKLLSIPRPNHPKIHEFYQFDLHYDQNSRSLPNNVIRKHSGYLRVASPSFKQLIDNITQIAAVNDHSSILWSISHEISRLPANNILDTASAHGSGKVFSAMLSLSNIDIDGNTAERYIRNSLNTGNRSILSDIAKETQHLFVICLFRMMMVKSDRDIYPIPDIAECWKYTPIDAMVGFFYSKGVPDSLYYDMKKYWPNTTHVLSSYNRTREGIQEALLCFPEDAPTPGICSLVGLNRNNTCRKSLYWITIAMGVICVSIILLLVLSKLYMPFF